MKKTILYISFGLVTFLYGQTQLNWNTQLRNRPNITRTGSNSTWTDNVLNTQLNNCQYVSTLQTLPAAIAAVSNPGCIVVTSSYTMAASSTVPAGVTLAFQQSGGLTTTGFTLTINGPISAPAAQIFFGTGTIVLGSSNPIRAIWFPGSDFHAKLQNAYNALPTAPSAGKIFVDPNPAGGCWVTTTTASLNTANKYANIIAESPASPNVPQQGFCDSFTPTIIGSAGTISAISDAANLVTVTCSATCTTGWTGGGGSTATIITVRGVTVPDYNGVWPVQTVTDGTHFTYNASIGAPSASSGGTVAQSPYAIELDWTPNGGGGYDPTAGMSGYILDNNGCSMNGGCGSYAVGILLSRTNAGLHASPMYNLQIHGFGTGIAKINTVNCQTGWGTNWIAVSLSWNNVGVFIGCANENDGWMGNSKVAVNGTGFQIAGFGAEISFFGGSFDSQTICGVQLDAGTIWHSTDLHYENLGPSVTPTAYACSTAVNSILDITGGIAYDDGNGAGTNNWFQAGYITATNLSLNSAKLYAAQWVFAAGTRGKVDVINVTPTNLPLVIFGNGTSNILINTQNPTSSMYTPVLGVGENAVPFGGATAANIDLCYGDSTLHALKCSYNNGTYFQIPQVITATSAAFATATTAGTCVQNTTAVTFAATTMSVAVSPVSTPGVGAVWSGFVSSAGNVTINECAVATSAGGTIAFNIRVTP